MRKYIFLIVLCCASLTLGAFMYASAHSNTKLASVAVEQEELYSDTIDASQSQDLNTSSGFIESTKETAKDVTENLAKALFSLIYK